MKKTLIAAGIAMLVASNAHAQSMTISEATELSTVVGMGAGIGEACRLDAGPLNSSFERMKAAKRFSEPEKAALSRAYARGLNSARAQRFDVSACVSARQIWKRQVETLTMSMAAAQR